MYPEDSVLIAVVNRRRDLAAVFDEHWYRVPLKHMPGGIEVQYIGFFLSRQFGKQNSAVRYFAPVQGVELVYRHWLLPEESTHPRSHEQYYRFALGDVLPKSPPITNPKRRIISFINTTWEHFMTARTVDELYLRVSYRSYM